EEEGISSPTRKNSGFINIGQLDPNGRGKKLFYDSLRIKGASDQLIKDVISSWRTQWDRHVHGLTRLGIYLDMNNITTNQLLSSNVQHIIIANWLSSMKYSNTHAAIKEARTAANMLFEVVGQSLPQKLIQLVMKEHIRESAKVISEEEIWHLDVLLEHLQNISKNRNLTQPKILAACLSSIIA
ncbi:MAG: hypothetical protein EZS28_025749, partial [Streblomastix strix]